VKFNPWRDEIVTTIFGNVGVIQDDFFCAIERNLLLQGRMYVTNRFLCFYTNLFGFEKKIKIPYSSITTVSRINTVGIPNAILVQTAKSEYAFRSFWDREMAFVKINESIDAAMAARASKKASSSSLVGIARAAAPALGSSTFSPAASDGIEKSPREVAQIRRSVRASPTVIPRLASGLSGLEPKVDPLARLPSGEEVYFEAEAGPDVGSESLVAARGLAAAEAEAAFLKSRGESSDLIDEDGLAPEEEAAAGGGASAAWEPVDAGAALQDEVNRRTFKYKALTAVFPLTVDGFLRAFVTSDGGSVLPTDVLPTARKPAPPASGPAAAADELGPAAVLGVPDYHELKGDSEMKVEPWKAIGGVSEGSGSDAVGNGVGAAGVPSARRAAGLRSLVRTFRFRTPIVGSSFGPSSTRATKTQVAHAQVASALWFIP
jgi:hypothetical protein